MHSMSTVRSIGVGVPLKQVETLLHQLQPVVQKVLQRGVGLHKSQAIHGEDFGWFNLLQVLYTHSRLLHSSVQEPCQIQKILFTAALPELWFLKSFLFI